MCTLESCVLKLPKHQEVKRKISQFTICLKYYNESSRRTNREGVVIGENLKTCNVHGLIFRSPCNLKQPCTAI